MPYLRTIFIGLGGAGIDTLECLEQKFIANSSSGNIPRAVRFLGIDSDYNKLKNNDIRLDSSDAYLHYLSDSVRGINSGVPESNIKYLHNVSATGSGCCRSNGRYLFKMNLSRISDSITRLKYELNHIDLYDNDVILTPTIDVHIITSSCGGTGSGILLELARLVRQIIPTSRVFAYIYSDSFYQHLPFARSPIIDYIKQNAKACIWEMSYEQKLFDFSTLIGSSINNYVISLPEAINRLSEILKYAIFHPHYYNWFIDHKSSGLISNWLSLGCHKITYNKELIIRQLVEKVFYNDTSPSNGEPLEKIISQIINQVEAWGAKNYIPHVTNFESFASNLSTYAFDVLHKANIQLNRTIDMLVQNNAKFQTIDTKLEDIKCVISDNERGLLDKLASLQAHKKYAEDELQYEKKKLLSPYVNRYRIQGLEDEILGIRYEAKISEMILWIHREFISSVNSLESEVQELYKKIDLLLKENYRLLHRLYRDDHIINGITSYINLDAINFNISEIIKEVFSEGVHSCVSDERIMKIIGEHIYSDTFFNAIPNPQEYISSLSKLSLEMNDRELNCQVGATLEQWSIQHPRNLNAAIIALLHQTYNANSIYDQGTDEEIVVIYQKGYKDYTTMLNDQLLRLNYVSGRYCPFSDSYYEQLYNDKINSLQLNT